MNVGRYLRGEDRHVGTARTTQPQPPQRTWVDLSDEDIEECFTVTPDLYLKRHIAQRISAKLKEKNQ